MSPFCSHTVGQNLFSWTHLTAREARKKGRTQVLGSSNTVCHKLRTCRVDLLCAVSCPQFLTCLDPGFHFHSPDVDECANPRACPENATCHNSLGSYSCVCSPGFESSTGNISFHVPEGTCEGRRKGLWGTQVQIGLQKDSSDGGGVGWISTAFKTLICKAEASNHSFIHSFTKHL